MTTHIPPDYDAALTARRNDLRSLSACAREFARHRSPQVLGAGVALVSVARAVEGRWSWRDALVPPTIVALQPFVEWVIHKYLLHLPPAEVRGRNIEIPSAGGASSPSPRAVRSRPRAAFRARGGRLPRADRRGHGADRRCRRGGPRGLIHALVAHRHGMLLPRPIAVRVVALPHPHALRPQEPVVPGDLAQPPPSPLQARGVLARGELELRRPSARHQSRSPRRRTLTDRSHARRPAATLSGENVPSSPPADSTATPAPSGTRG